MTDGDRPAPHDFHDNPRGPSRLYPRLLGSSWPELAEPIRILHATGAMILAHGRFHVDDGGSYVARIVSRLLRFPRGNPAAATRLVIHPDIDGERWQRTFDRRQLDTRQFAAADGLLAERFGILEFHFRLEVSEGGLRFRHLHTAVAWGALRLRLPDGWSPRIHAREDPSGPRQIRVHVRIVAPLVGPLLTYDGTMDLEHVLT